MTKHFYSLKTTPIVFLSLSPIRSLISHYRIIEAMAGDYPQQLYSVNIHHSSSFRIELD
jgi:hypothetical protein